ncbi:hypothetical protein [Paenibacillus durus]|uniref:Uncharacterized protein n=1 Tax=Paenibacillus durus ATCC 35681 TaxID=1333534 RepID=A0A0F7FAF5_PAEDU|nr:hypothetical protein [Paenibacillus durus]AKG35649.1 hypothetical protein VK70_14580 [Paenibacillus durus ATCC 35681]
MHVVHELRIEDEKVLESVSIYDTAASMKPRETLPRSYGIELLRDPVLCAVESLAIGAGVAQNIDKKAAITFRSNIPGAAELFAEEWARR